MKNLLACALAFTVTPAVAQQAPAPSAATPAIPATFMPPTDRYDYGKREVMIPMRDGVKLHTVIIVPKGAKDAPILLTRTPYNAPGRARRLASPEMLSALPQGDEPFVRAGYIRIFQDIRGRYGSEGEYVVTKPVIGPLNTSGDDHVTDAYDTIDRLVKTARSPRGRR